MCWARLGEKGLPPHLLPLLLCMFQGGQVLHPSPKCVVSTGGSQEGLGCLLGPWEHSQTITTSYNDRPDSGNPSATLSR